MKEDIKIKFWDIEDAEHLKHTTKDEAIEDILDGIDELSGELEICGYAPFPFPCIEDFAQNVLENVLEDLDCNYELGDIDDYTRPTDMMRSAAIDFIKVIAKEYFIYSCEVVKRETIDIEKWVKENRPDWLESKKENS